MRRPWLRALVYLVLLGSFFYASYGLANYVSARRAEVPSIVFAWEARIPFWPWTIFPYWSINVFYALSLLLAPKRRVLDRHALRLLSAQLLAVGCFLLWPLRFSFGQPEVSGAPAFLFAALRSFDAPFNQAPSLHIALAVVLWDFYQRLLSARLARWLLHAWTLVVSLSVLTTYQHHFIDIPTGALLGVMCVWLWPLEPRVPMLCALRPARAWRRWHIAFLYALGAAACAAVTWHGLRTQQGWLLWFAWPAWSLWLVALIYAALGARGFCIDKHGRMHWSARWMLAPHRGLARLSAFLWATRTGSANQVLPGMWLGRLPTARGWNARGRPALVSLCAELQMPRAANGRCVPLLDLTIPEPGWLLKASHAIDSAQPGATHVCCALGISRSAAVLACWLVCSGRAADLEQAVQVIRRVRPQILLSPGWLRVLREAIVLHGRRRCRIR